MTFFGTKEALNSAEQPISVGGVEIVTSPIDGLLKSGKDILKSLNDEMTKEIPDPATIESLKDCFVGNLKKLEDEGAISHQRALMLTGDVNFDTRNFLGARDFYSMAVQQIKDLDFTTEENEMVLGYCEEKLKDLVFH